MYNCGSGPWGGPPSSGYPNYIPVPSSMDPDRAMEFLEKMEKWSERQAEKEKKKAEDAKKKEGDKKKDPSKTMFSGTHVFLILMSFGIPVGAFQLLLWNVIVLALKEHLLK